MLTYHADEILDRLQSIDMKYEEIRSKITERLTQLIKDSKTTRLKDGALDYQDRRNLEVWEDQYRRYKPDDYHEEDMLVSNASRHISNMFDNPSLNTEQRKTFVLEFIRQYPKAIGEILEFNKNPKDINFNVANPDEVIGEQTPITETIDAYIEEQLQGNNWIEETELERRRYLKALTGILGKDFITEKLTKKIAREVKGIVSTLPVRWTIKKETKHLSIRDAAKSKIKPTISVKTRNEYMVAYSTYGKWLEDMGYLNKNPFSNMTTSINNEEQARDAFSIVEIKRILSAIEDSKIKGSRKKSRYWGIMIAAYTGMRREEIAQLHVEDIKLIDDLYCIDINKNTDDKRLKSKSSKRIIPVHQNILDKGFIEHVENIKTRGYKRVFPDLKSGVKHRYGRNLGDWFNGTFLKQLDIKTKKNAFHSFRHTVATELGEIAVNDSLQKRILGHSMANDITARYDHSQRLELMKEALERLPY